MRRPRLPRPTLPWKRDRPERAGEAAAGGPAAQPTPGGPQPGGGARQPDPTPGGAQPGDAQQPAPAAAGPQPDPAAPAADPTAPATSTPEPGADPGRGRLRRLRGPALPAAALLIGIGAGLAGGYALFDDERTADLPAVAPTVVLEQTPEPEAAEEIGFPAFATRNTTRVGGADPIADAAGVALASYPAGGGVEGPRLAVLAPAGSWQVALAAGSLAAGPIAAPILLGEADEIPGFTAEALAGLGPTGIERADGVQVLAIGDVAAPEGLETETIEGSDPARLARLIDRHRQRYGGAKDPDSILVVSSKQSDFAMPAAAWAARSGDPIAFAAGDEVPESTLQMLASHPDASVYVLGPESAISDRALRRIERESERATRIGAEDPVENAIEFARFVDGDFGWNVNDPGHGFVIANLDRPADAGAAAPLSAGGKPGPLLLTDSAEQVPRPLRAFLLDTKPGFSEDPTRAVYNHLWLLGDTSALSLGFQAQVDELTRLQRVSRGTGVPDFLLTPDEPEAEQPREADEPETEGSRDADGR